jgi:hypothetical protein
VRMKEGGTGLRSCQIAVDGTVNVERSGYTTS